MTALYNEIDPFAAAWLRSLISAGHVATGVVDERSIVDLKPADVAGPGQRHFFAGIGGWSYALRLAGVSDNADIWTGSCPCQPFSSAGKRGGTRDPRHLWPAWFELIRECRPATIFGEQVASRDGLAWLDLVRADLERCGYAFGASDLCAAGVGAPHIRQRLYFVAHADGDRRIEGVELQPTQRRPRPEVSQANRGGEARQLEHASRTRGRRNARANDRAKEASAEARTPTRCGGDEPFATSVNGIVADAEEQRRDERRVVGSYRRQALEPWRHCDALPCTDGVSRSVEPGTFPLAHGVPGRVGRLRGYGNAIVPQVAAIFIQAALEAIAMTNLAARRVG